MNYYTVIDTNVLVSALLKSASIPGIVARESLEGQIIPLLNDEIIAEYRAVLSRPKFKFSPEAVELIIDGLIRRGIFLDADPTDELVIDPKDVVEARKEDDAYLVTGNIKHFPAKRFVVTPREMLEILEMNGD